MPWRARINASPLNKFKLTQGKNPIQIVCISIITTARVRFSFPPPSEENPAGPFPHLASAGSRCYIRVLAMGRIQGGGVEGRCLPTNENGCRSQSFCLFSSVDSIAKPQSILCHMHLYTNQKWGLGRCVTPPSYLTYFTK